MTETEVQDACISLQLLEGDIEWWEEQGLTRVRPLLKNAWKAICALQQENRLLHARITELEAEKNDWPEEVEKRIIEPDAKNG